MPKFPERVQKLLAQAKQNKLHPGSEISKCLERSLRCAQEHLDPDYTREALRLLEDEYIWISACDIAKIFQESQCSYAISWFVLNDLDANGDQSAFQLKFMEVARKPAPTKLSTIRATSCPLQAEVDLVRAWNDRQQREFQVWADGLFFFT